MLGGGPVICGCGDGFCPGCDRIFADDEKCWCGRRLRFFPGEIEPTCAGCGNKPDWCDCERPRTWESGHGEGDLAAGDGPVAERLGALRTALLDSAALDSIPPPSPVIDGMLYRDGLAWLHGRPASYKSFVALDWAGCVAAGLPWQERETAQCPVLYLIAEGTAGLRKRVRAWEDYADCTMLATFLPVPVQLLNPVDLAAFRALVADLAPGLVIIDTQARVTVGADENSAREMGQLVQAADAIRAACGACVLIVHHEGRAGENMRGSSALDGAATSIFRTAREGNRVTLENIRQRDVPEADDVQFHAIPRLDSIVLAGGQTSNWTFDEMADSEVKIRDALLDVFLDTGASPSNLIEVTKLPKSTAYWAIGQLVRRGSIVNTGTRKRPHYETAQGNVQLSPTPSNPSVGPTSNVQPPFKGVGQLDAEQSGDKAPVRVKVAGDLYHGRVPDGAVYVGRQARGLPRSKFANPYKDKPRAELAEAYREWISGQPELLDAARSELAGHDLACWCPVPSSGQPDHCHAAVLLEIANLAATVATEGEDQS